MTPRIQRILIPARAPLLCPQLVSASISEGERDRMVAFRQAMKAVFKPSGRGESTRPVGAGSLSLG
jgi:hypothetical protein